MEEMATVGGKAGKKRGNDVLAKKKLLARLLGVFVDHGGDPETHAVASSRRLDHDRKVGDRFQRNLAICELDCCRTDEGDGTEEDAYAVDGLNVFGEKSSLDIVISVLENGNTQIPFCFFVCISNHFGDCLKNGKQARSLIILEFHFPIENSVLRADCPKYQTTPGTLETISCTRSEGTIRTRWKFPSFAVDCSR